MTEDYITVQCEDHIVGDHVYRTIVDVFWPAPVAWAGERLLALCPSSGDIYEVGPYIGKVVPGSYDFSSRAILLQKVDHPLSWAYIAKWRARQVWEWFTVRTVYTLAIWGLAFGEREMA